MVSTRGYNSPDTLKVIAIPAWLRRLSAATSLCLAAAAPAQERFPDQRYLIKGGEAYDRLSRLTWQRCSVGQQWRTDEGCVGEILEFNFDQAQTLNRDGWRVPSKTELETLLDYRRVPKIDTVAFPAMQGYWYWSSTSLGPTRAFSIRFNSEYTGGYGRRKLKHAVRLVTGPD